MNVSYLFVLRLGAEAFRQTPPYPPVALQRHRRSCCMFFQRRVTLRTPHHLSCLPLRKSLPRFPRKTYTSSDTCFPEKKKNWDATFKASEYDTFRTSPLLTFADGKPLISNGCDAPPISRLRWGSQAPSDKYLRYFPTRRINGDLALPNTNLSPALWPELYKKSPHGGTARG